MDFKVLTIIALVLVFCAGYSVGDYTSQNSNQGWTSGYQRPAVQHSRGVSSGKGITVWRLRKEHVPASQIIRHFGIRKRRPSRPRHKTRHSSVRKPSHQVHSRHRQIW